MPKVKGFTNTNYSETIGYTFRCPGCGEYHAVFVKPHKNHVGASWEFNGDLEKPSFTPSLLQRTQSGDGNPQVCHCFVTSGKLAFLPDCTHKLANQTVEMPEVAY